MRVIPVIVVGDAYALTPVAGVSMVVRSVRALLTGAFVDWVTVLAAEALRHEVERACAAEPVDVRPIVALDRVGAHAVQRPRATKSDGIITAGTGDVVLLHDACRPLAPGVLAGAVVEAVRGGHAMAVPALPLTDTVKLVDGSGLVTGTADREALRVLQTPIAARAELLSGWTGDDPLAAVRRHTAAGGTVHIVPGHPSAFVVRSTWDLELAELIAGGRIRL